jgi:hypothetical protein
MSLERWPTGEGPFYPAQTSVVRANQDRSERAASWEEARLAEKLDPEGSIFTSRPHRRSKPCMKAISSRTLRRWRITTAR